MSNLEIIVLSGEVYRIKSTGPSTQPRETPYENVTLMCILSHASYISDLLNISIFIFVEHQNIRPDILCQHNK